MEEKKKNKKKRKKEIKNETINQEPSGRDSLCKVSKLINELTKKRGVKVSKLTEVVVPGMTLAILRIGAGIVNNTLRPTIPSDCDSEWRRLMEL
ncbi:hypothetical protein Tco_0933114 [Tanacetum coccineum]